MPAGGGGGGGGVIYYVLLTLDFVKLTCLALYTINQRCIMSINWVVKIHLEAVVV